MDIRNDRMKSRRPSQAERVVIVLASREPQGAPAGGIHKAVLAQIAALHAQGIGVSLLTASVPCAESAARMGAETDVSAAWHHSVKPLLFPRFWFKLLALRMRGGVRCVIHHSGRTWLWGHVFFAGIPQVQVFHRELVRPYRFFLRWLALSPGYAAHLARHHALGGLRKISWAPNALIHEPEPPPPPKTGGCFTIGFLGRAGAGKGIDTLLAAVARLMAAGRRIELRFGGDGDDYVRPLAERLGLVDCVVFTGWHADPDEFIDPLDLLVLPSIKESFGLVLIEAMARAKPVLATRCNGPASIIVDGENGFLVPIGDEEELAEKLAMAMDHPRLTAMGEAGFRRVMEHYIPARAGIRLVEALCELGARFTGCGRPDRRQ